MHDDDLYPTCNNAPGSWGVKGGRVVHDIDRCISVSMSFELSLPNLRDLGSLEILLRSEEHTRSAQEIHPQAFGSLV